MTSISVDQPTVADLVAAGIAALKSGQAVGARELLIQALQIDPANAPAWLWLSGAVPADAERRYCLERVLELDPDHVAARRGLDRLARDIAAESPLPAPVGVPERAAAAASAPPEPAPAGPRIGGRYEVVAKRAGGMGLVFLCIDHQEQRPVALKTFRPEYLANLEARDLFLREGTTWVSLGRHPHIVPAHTVARFKTGSEIYLVLEWIVQPGDKPDASLRAWLEPDQPLPVEQALSFALHVARGMRYATKQIPGLVHRDLKPENILVGQDGLARVTDFGLANTRPAKSGGIQLALRIGGAHRKAAADVAGTPLYMAPEQWQPGAALDARADIYAFGCILYELLTGTRAAPGETEHELEQAHRSGKLRALPRWLPPELAALLQRCLQRKREARYESWTALEAAVANAYRQVIGNEPAQEQATAALTSNHRVETGWSLHTMGLSYRDIGKQQVAERYLDQALLIAQAERDRALEASCRANLGTIYLLRGERAQAEACFQTCLLLTRELGDRQGEGAALGDLASIFRSQGQWQAALDLYEQHLQIAQQLQSRSIETGVLINMADIYLEHGQRQRAMALYEQALPYARRFRLWSWVAHILAHLAKIARLDNDMKRAIGYYQQAVQIAYETGDRPEQAQALSGLGNTLIELGERQRALGCFEEALTVVREAGNLLMQANILRSMGHVYRESGKHRQAIQLYEQSIAISQRLGRPGWEAAGLLGLATSQAALGDKRRAMTVYERCIALTRGTSNPSSGGVASYNIATLLVERQQLAEARPYLEYALVALDDPADWRVRQAAERLLARIWNR